MTEHECKKTHRQNIHNYHTSLTQYPQTPTWKFCKVLGMQRRKTAPEKREINDCVCIGGSPS